MESWKSFVKRGKPLPRQQTIRLSKFTKENISEVNSPFQMSFSTSKAGNPLKESENRTSVASIIDEGEDLHIVEKHNRQNFDSDHSSLVLAEDKEMLQNPIKSSKRFTHSNLGRSLSPLRRNLKREHSGSINFGIGQSSLEKQSQGKLGEQAATAMSQAKLERLLNQMEADFSKREASSRSSISSVEIKEGFDFCWLCLEEINRVRMLSNPKYLSDKGMPQNQSIELRIFKRIKKIFALMLGKHIAAIQQAQSENNALTEQNRELQTKLKEVSLEFFSLRDEVTKEWKIKGISKREPAVSAKLAIFNELTKKLAAVENEDVHKEVNLLKIENQRLKQRLHDVKAEMEKKASRARENYQQKRVLFKSSGAVEQLRRLHEILTEKNEVLIHEDQDLLSEANPQNFNFALEKEMQKTLTEVKKETTQAVIKAFTKAKPTKQFGQTFLSQNLREQAKQHSRDLDRLRRELNRAKDKSDRMADKMAKLELENNQIKAYHEQTKDDLAVLKRENQMLLKKSAALQLEIDKLNFTLIAAENARDKSKAKVMELLDTLQDSSKTAEEKAETIKKLDERVRELEEELENIKLKSDVKRTLSTPYAGLKSLNTDIKNLISAAKVETGTQTDLPSPKKKSAKEADDYFIVKKLKAMSRPQSRHSERPGSMKEAGKAKKTNRSARTAKSARRGLRTSASRLGVEQSQEQENSAVRESKRKMDVRIDITTGREGMDSFPDSQEISPVNLDPKGLEEQKREGEKQTMYSVRPYSHEMYPRSRQMVTGRTHAHLFQYSTYNLGRDYRSASLSEMSSAMPSSRHMHQRYEEGLRHFVKPLLDGNAKNVGVQVELLRPRFIIRRNFGTGTVTLATAPGSVNPSPSRQQIEQHYFLRRNQFSAPHMLRMKSRELNSSTPVNWRGGFVPGKIKKVESIDKASETDLRRTVNNFHKKARSQSSTSRAHQAPIRKRHSGLPYIERTARSIIQKSFFPPPIIRAEVTEEEASSPLSHYHHEQKSSPSVKAESPPIAKIEEEYQIQGHINLEDKGSNVVTEQSASSFDCFESMRGREERKQDDLQPLIVQEFVVPSPERPSSSQKKSSRKVFASGEQPHPLISLKVKRVVGQKQINANPLDRLVVGRRCLQERQGGDEE